MKNSNILKHANKNFKNEIAPLINRNINDQNFRKGIRNDEIVGHWCEDNNEYIIRCPSQLRDCLLEALNNLDALEFKEKL